MDNESVFETNFYKMNLSTDDILVLKIDISGMTEEQASKRLELVREDEFVKYIESKGNKVIVSYTGIDFAVLKLDEGDKVIAYLDVSPLDENDEERYVNKFKGSLNHIFGEKLVTIPTRNGSPVLGILEGEK